MNLEDKVIVVTGAAHGIGKALSERFRRERPRGLLLADRDTETLESVAKSVEGLAVPCDVSSEPDVRNLVSRAIDEFGQVDLFCANAGIGVSGGVEVPDNQWKEVLDVNFMSHVYAARAVLPPMLARGEGYLLHTASAAGLLTQIGSAPYSVSKHAVVSLAEWLAIAHGDQGIRVSCLCPQGVRTQMLEGDDDVIKQLAAEALAPEQVADAVVDGLQQENFLILPHPEVAEYFRRKATDYDRWLSGMRRYQGRVHNPTG